MYSRYEKKHLKDGNSYKFVDEACLFGCNEGFIPWLLGEQTPSQQEEPYKWHLNIESALSGTEYAGSTLIIDLKPKQKETISLYEVVDVWGYSDADWTPILLHLKGLFVDTDRSKVNEKNFTIKSGGKEEEPIYEFLYLNGSVSGGKLYGPWVAPPASPTNGALLWPETLKYFVNCIRERTPNVLGLSPALVAKAATA